MHQSTNMATPLVSDPKKVDFILACIDSSANNEDRNKVHGYLTGEIVPSPNDSRVFRLTAEAVARALSRTPPPTPDPHCDPHCDPHPATQPSTELSIPGASAADSTWTMSDLCISPVTRTSLPEGWPERSPIPKFRLKPNGWMGEIRYWIFLYERTLRSLIGQQFDQVAVYWIVNWLESPEVRQTALLMAIRQPAPSWSELRHNLVTYFSRYDFKEDFCLDLQHDMLTLHQSHTSVGAMCQEMLTYLLMMPERLWLSLGSMQAFFSHNFPVLTSCVMKYGQTQQAPTCEGLITFLLQDEAYASIRISRPPVPHSRSKKSES